MIVASEPMDENPAWRPLASGELVHVDGQQRASSHVAVTDAPAHRLTLADLDPTAARSQAAKPRDAPTPTGA